MGGPYRAPRPLSSPLNTATDFFVGWGNRLSFGVSMYLGKNSYLNQIRSNSTAYYAGDLIGSIHFAAIGMLSGTGACQVGHLISAARGYSSVEAAVSVGQTLMKGW